MPSILPRCAALLAAAFALLLGASASAQEASAWSEAFDTFASADRQVAPTPGGIIFVGSSSIRLWKNLDHAFEPGRLVLNRGFGGSQLSDCVANVDRLVVAYRPRLVFLYAGDNDLAAGVRPEVVVERFARFVTRVRDRLPDTRIIYISIKPSPARAELIPRMRQANALIEKLADADPAVDYVDVFTPMLDRAGHPREELFLPDRLHMNAQGYALWKDLIEPLVR